MATPAPGPGRVRFSVFEADLRSGELRKGGHRVHLASQPFELLALLLEHPGEVVTREELREKLWPADVFVDFDQSLNKAVNKVREALGDSAEGPRFVETLPRRGYRFIVPVARMDEEPPPQAMPGTEALRGARATPRPRWPFVAFGLVLLGMAFGFWALRGGSPSPRASRALLVVLPFENLSGHADEDYWSDGLTEEMIAQLGSLQPARLGVIARTSAMQFKAAKKTVEQIARELHVDYILEGSVRRDAGRVRITAQLIETAGQTHLWAESYDRDVGGVLAIQEEVARRIASSLALELLPSRSPPGPRRATSSTAAYDAYLKGRFLWNKRTEDSLRKGLRSFEESVAADPDFALGYVGLADSWNVLADYALVPPREAAPKSEAAARKALALDPELAEAHAALGYAHWSYGYDAAAADLEFRRALELRPGYVAARYWYGAHLAKVGRFEEARDQLARAQELDPFSMIVRANAAAVSYFAREPAKAVAECRKGLELDPGFPVLLWILGLAHEDAGESSAALLALDKAIAASEDNPTYKAARAHVLAVSGREAEARLVLGELMERRKMSYVSPYDLALLHSGLREKDQAFAWLGESLAQRSSAITELKVDPRLDGLRTDPRFAALVKRAGLP